MTRLEQLRAQAEEIRRIAARHKEFGVAVFGSVASLGGLYLLQEELEAFLKTQVDVVSRGGLKPRDAHIRAEALAL
jgi:predicted nucleotidyltransferase